MNPQSEERLLQARGLLCLRRGGLGDFLLTLPLLAQLRRRWPRAVLHLWARPEMAELARLSGYADQIQSIERGEIARLFSPSPKSPQLSRELLSLLRGIDLAIHFFPDPEGNLTRHLGRFVPHVLAVPPPPEEGPLHATEHFCRQLQPWGVSPEVQPPRLRLPLPLLADAARFLESHIGSGRTAVVLHPGSGSPRKNLPPSLFAAFYRALAKQPDLQPVLLEGEADEETVEAVCQQLAPSLPLRLRQLPLLRAAGLLASCRALIGNDSGISHLAAALGRPVLAFFGPTRPEVWRPLGTVRVLKFEEADPAAVLRWVRSLPPPS